MRGRFPPDLMAVVFGPVIVIVVALGLSSLIFHAAEVGSSAAARVAIAVIIVALLGSLFFRRRRP